MHNLGLLALIGMALLLVYGHCCLACRLEAVRRAPDVAYFSGLISFDKRGTFA